MEHQSNKKVVNHINLSGKNNLLYKTEIMISYLINLCHELIILKLKKFRKKKWFRSMNYKT